MATKCPTCNSPAPRLHPAMQFEGEVQPCSDAWHTGPQTAGGWAALPERGANDD